MFNALGLYGHYISISFRSQMQYRASFLMLSFGHFLITGIEFVAIAALFDRFGQISGWQLPEIAMLYVIVNTAFALSDAMSRGFDVFGNMVKSGDFDRLLLRPRSTALQLAGQEFTLRRVGRLAQSVLVFLWANSHVEIVWSADKIALFALAIVGGACFFFALMVIQATVAFWTTESLELMNTMTYGGVQTAQYPLSIYRAWFRKFFTYAVPLASVSYYPGLALLGREDPYGSPALFHHLAPLIGILFLVLAFQIWKIGVRHYRSTGS
ncbi:MAG: ABC-2 family transporter protein [bacterium]|nr:ABC-2 family transporter protein [bacterium]